MWSRLPVVTVGLIMVAPLLGCWRERGRMRSLVQERERLARHGERKRRRQLQRLASALAALRDKRR
jgi:hypothetical protein